MAQDVTCHGNQIMELGLVAGDFVLGRDPKSGRSHPAPIFGPFLLWPNDWMHQDDTWYGGRFQPKDFVLDVDPAPSSSQKGGGARGARGFGPCLLWPNGWMDQDRTWHGGRSWSSQHCARCRHSFTPPKRGQSPPPIFGPFLLSPDGWLNQDGTWH